MFRKELFLILFAFIILAQCTPRNNRRSKSSGTKAETDKKTSGTYFDGSIPKREFRAAWVATVENIDWPSNRNLNSNQQQNEFINILNKHQSIGINAVLVQVRAASDAFYARSFEPWSEWLTGQQGKSPSPNYDPMRFMIEESHARNMEFHAWLNLNRGAHKTSKTFAENSVTRLHPEWFLSYDGMKIYNFGLPEVRDYIIGVILNIVKEYDVDGIHLDDYFYPYTVTGQTLKDGDAFKKYGKGFDNVKDWRRNNIDLLIRDISKKVSAEKKWVKFGISPFGVWRNSDKDITGSETQAGQTSYDDLCADTKKWAKLGWIDYIAPQIYFSFEHPKVAYKKLADWWSENHGNRHLYIGQSTYKVDKYSIDPYWKDPSQMPRQMTYNRGNSEISGSIFYNTSSLLKNNLGFGDSLKKIYKYPVLQPTMPWKDDLSPYPPERLSVKRVNQVGAVLNWSLPSKLPRDSDMVKSFVVYRFDEGESLNLENPTKILSIIRNIGMLSYIDKTVSPRNNYVYIITALDRMQNESEGSEPFTLK